MKRFLLITSIIVILAVLFNVFYLAVNKLAFFDEEILSSEKNKTQLIFIHWMDFPDEIFKDFEEEYPDIQIKYERLDVTDYSDLIRARLVSQNHIDIFGIKMNDYADFITRGYLQDLTNQDYIEALNPSVNKGVKDLIFNHRQYAISYNACSYGIWYNKSIFSRNNIEVPSTYEAFIEACRQLKNAGINPIVMGARDDMSMRVTYLLSDYLASESMNLQENLENGKVLWTDEPIIDAISKVSYLIDEELIMKESIYFTYQQAFQEFVKGSAAMTIMSSNSMDLGQIDFEQQAGEFGVFALPSNQATDTMVNSLEYGNELMGIFLKTEHFEEANLFLEFITRPDTVKKYVDYKKVAVPVKDIDLANIKYSKQWALLEENPNKAITTYFMDYRLENDFDALTKQLMIGNITVSDMAQTLNQLQEQINREDKEAYK